MTRTDDTPYRIADVLRRGPATWTEIILAPEFAGTVGGSIPSPHVLAALLELVDVGTVNTGPNAWPGAQPVYSLRPVEVTP